MTFYDLFLHQNLLNCQTKAIKRKKQKTLHVCVAFVSDCEQGNKKIVQKFRYEIFEFQLRTIENVISQRQVTIKQRSLAHFSPHFMGFPHAFTC